MLYIYNRPGFIALKLCKDLQFIKCDFNKYTRYASQICSIFAQYDSDYAAASLDEAYLDVTDYIHNNKQLYLTDNYESTIPAMPDYLPVLHVSSGKSGFWASSDNVASSYKDVQDLDINMLVAYRIAEQIRHKIYIKTGLTASAGISCNRMLCKVASDYNKPFGQCCIVNTTDIIQLFMSQLNIRKVPGIGKSMERVLNELLNVNKCNDVVKPDTALIVYNLFSYETASWLISRCVGLAENVHSTAEDNKRKSISCERTFSEINTYDSMVEKCKEIAISLAEDVHDHSVNGKCITLKLKNTDFTVFQRSSTLPRYINTVQDITKYALQILKTEYDKLQLQHISSKGSNYNEPVLKLRLMGIRLSNLQDISSNNTIDNFLKRSNSNKTQQQRNNNESNNNVILNEDSLFSMNSNNDNNNNNNNNSKLPTQCPLCNRTFDVTADNYTINEHLDKCLSIPQGWMKNSSNAATRSITIKGNQNSNTKNNHNKTIDMYTDKNNNANVKLDTNNNVSLIDIVTTNNIVKTNFAISSAHSIDSIDVDTFFSV